MMVGSEWFHDGILMERVADNGDGTGTRTVFHPDGTVDTVEQLTGLPIPPPPEPDPLVDLQAQLAAQQTLVDDLVARVDAGVALTAMGSALAPLSSASTSAQQRSALLALRAAINEALDG